MFGTIFDGIEGKSHSACVATATPFRGQALAFPGRLADWQTPDLVLANLIPTVKLKGEKRRPKGVMGVLVADHLLLEAAASRVLTRL